MTKDEVREHLLKVFQEVEQITGPLPDAYIAGGCIASLLLGEEVKDYDFWFSQPDEMETATKKVQSTLAFKDSKYATSFTIVSLESGEKEIQLVKSRMGIPEVIVPGFDFKHTHSYMKRDGTLICDEEFILKKQLIFIPGNFGHPVNTMQRVNKFARRGYDIPFETTRDLMVACTGLDPETIGKSDRHGGSL